MQEGGKPLVIELQAVKIINFAFQQNNIPIVQRVSVRNNSGTPLSSLTLKIWTEPEICIPYECRIDAVGDAPVVIDNIKLKWNAAYFAGLTERVSGNIRAAVLCGGETIASADSDITALAFDEWHGASHFPELLSAFVTPNHPKIFGIISKASKFLEEWTDSPSFDAYQSKNRNRIFLQAASIYYALKELNIIYVVPPASFELEGQRVRLCDTVIAQRMGTCLDLVLLYASCLEAVGLRPLLIILKNHIFAGVWLEDMCFPEAAHDDASLISKRLSDGINELIVVECTCFVSGKDIEFDEAGAAAVALLKDAASIESIIDVRRARLSGIRPLPLRINAESGWQLVEPILIKPEQGGVPEMSVAQIDLTEQTAPATRKNQWERKLLDLGLRNSLINLRITRRMLPLLVHSLGELEDALNNEREFAIFAKPSEWKLDEDESKTFESVNNSAGLKELLHSEFQHGRLRAAIKDTELEAAVVNLYRVSKTLQEDSGVNSLFLALGTLRWYETESSEKPRYAPVVLLPVDMVRKSALKGYVIRMRDEEPQMNITLLEMLRQDFSIDVNGLDPLPLDAYGVDIRKVFAVLRNAVIAKKGWDILETACFGIFSFSQFVMWNDLRNRADELCRNKVVKSLIEGKLCWDAESMEIGDRVDEHGIYLPAPLDASQMFAVNAAKEGTTFVLHGPPGTGKSQTITVLIANALAAGKTVLFVAEKMAALSVVYKRLKAMGLGAFCLELHSNKTRKRDVLEQLNQLMDIRRRGTSEEYNKKSEHIAELRAGLDMYAERLHLTRTSGLAVYDMVCIYDKIAYAGNAMSFANTGVESLTESDIEQRKTIAGRMIATGRAVGHPHKHPLRRVRQTRYSQTLRAELPEVQARYMQALEKAVTTGNELAEKLGMSKRSSFADWEQLYSISFILALWKHIPRSWASVPDIFSVSQDIAKMAEHYSAACVLRENLRKHWKETFLTAGGAELAEKWRIAESKWFLPRFFGQRAVKKILAPHCKVSVGNLLAAASIIDLAKMQAESAAGGAIFDTCGHALGALYRDEETTNWQHIIDYARDVRKWSQLLSDASGSERIRVDNAGEPSQFALIDSFSDLWKKMMDARTVFAERLSLYDDKTESNWYGGELELFASVSAHSGELREWAAWSAVRAEAEAAGLLPLITAYEGGLSHEELIPAYEKALFKALISVEADSDEVLRAFSGAIFDEMIRRFKAIDAEMAELAKREIFYRLAARIPDLTREAVQSSEIGILQRAIRSGGRGISIRRLLDQMQTLLEYICPCMLMSPLSAAQYLGFNRQPFDMVVFDEASQLPTCKAVGAIARAREAIIVGDPKQMPPTSFFSTNMVDEDNPDMEDMESILDDCLALNMPQTYLLWHYRSRHESLIAFSNSRFYDNKLYTFPSVNERVSRVSLIHAAGVFDRGKTKQNKEEARLIVQELIRRYKDDELRRYSVGVVTFNIPQQNLISDMLNDEFRKDPLFELWAYEGEEPLFIKNLENVQGDERDVILFSIGYGPDKTGRVFMNFGPLNRDGGWRRLNVAVSRARHEMAVVTSLRADQIDLSRTNSEGVHALRAFIDYAGGGRLPVNVSSRQYLKHWDAGIALSVCASLKERGFDTQNSIGYSEFRIDVGVVDPENDGKFILGIMLDGDTYSESKTTRDRELAQISVLEGLGWRITRIWTMDWWDNREKEIDRIVKILETEERHPVAAVVAKPVIIETPEETPPPAGIDIYEAAEFPETVISSDEYVSQRMSGEVRRRLYITLQKEAPVHFDLLMKRVVQSLGIQRAGQRIQQYTMSLLEKMNVRGTVHDDRVICWTDELHPDTYKIFRASGEGLSKRDVKDVPVYEAANAVCAVLAAQFGMPREDLARETAKLLGYTRFTSVVDTAMNDAVSYTINKGLVVVRENNRLYLSDK